MISSLTFGLDSIEMGIISQVSDARGTPPLNLLYCHVESCCKNEALISRLGRLELINSKDLRRDQLNFIIR